MVIRKKSIELVKAIYKYFLFLTIFVFFFGFLIFKPLIKIYFHEYYYSVDPTFLVFELDEYNFYISLFLIIFFIHLSVFLFIKLMKDGWCFFRKSIFILLNIISISAFLGAMHSSLYYLNKDFYLIDKDVSMMYKKSFIKDIDDKINLIKKIKFENLKKIKSIENTGKFILSNFQKANGFLYGYERDFLYKYVFTVETDDFEYFLTYKEGISTASLDVRINFIDRSVGAGRVSFSGALVDVASSSGEFRASKALDEAYKGHFIPFFEKMHNEDLSSINKELLIDCFNYSNKSLDVFISYFEDRKKVSFDVLPWYLFIYDTILTSLTFGQGYYKVSSLFGRGLIFFQAVFFFLFVFYIANSINKK